MLTIILSYTVNLNVIVKDRLSMTVFERTLVAATKHRRVTTDN